MAETAELTECQGFDRYYYDVQRRQQLAPAIGSVALNAERMLGLEQRRRHELIDGIAEAIPGLVNNIRTYEMVEGRLVAEDGQEIEELLLNGLQHAIKVTAKDSFYAPFRPQRARHELDEGRAWQAMTLEQGSYNTIQAISPYTEEFCRDETIGKLQQAGQEPQTKRAMFRMAHWDGQKLHVLTRSIDNSSLSILKEASAKVDGYQYSASNTTDMLGERRELKMTKEEVFSYANNFVRVADEIIGRQLGGEYKQGRLISEAHDTQKHVESETQIIDNLMRINKRLALQYADYESYKSAWEKQLYDHTALIKERMLRGCDDTIVDVQAAASSSGAIAEARGETYNMCGMVVSGNGVTQAVEAGAFESVKSLIGKKVTCPECKEKVVIPKEKIEDGRLCCPDCKYELDICTGEVYTKSQKSKMAATNKPSVYEVFSSPIKQNMAMINAEISKQRSLSKKTAA